MQINVTCDRGSTGKIAYDLHGEYGRMGVGSVICYGRGKEMGEAGIYRVTGGFDVCAQVVRARVFGYVGRGSKAAAGRVLDLIEGYNPDVVHVHNLHGYYIDAYRVLEYLKKSGIKTVITMHDEWIFTGKCGYSYDCEGFKSGCGGCPRLGEYPESLFFDRSAEELCIKREIFTGFDNLLIVPVATWLMEKAKTSPHLSDKRFEVIYNGIDTDIFKPRDTGKLRERLGLCDKKILLHVTPDFNDPRKGGKYVLELGKRLADMNIKLVIAGASGDGEGDVLFIPRTESRLELAEYYSMADALLLTSEMECLPTVCLESLCCGTPVIGFDRGGARESAPEGHGVFVEYGDMNALEDIARRLLSGELGLIEKDSRIVFARKRYGRDIMAKRYIKAYEECF